MLRGALPYAIVLVTLSIHASHIVKTPLGKVKGVLVDGDIMGFFDVPYAEPMNATRRFRQALPKQPWQGTLDATNSNCTICLQPTASQFNKSHGAEDCLFANIFAPRQGPRKRKLPVLVWIHGGGLRGGSGCMASFQTNNNFMAEGHVAFSQQGIVVVSINYRLGILGFLQHEQLLHEDPAWPSYGGMNGIYDQIVALQWVQKNIEAFGGDPDQITVWGESAGGESTCGLMSTPLASGLFHRTIIESGACVSGTIGYGFGWGPGLLDEGLHAGRSAFQMLNATSIEELRSLDAHDLLAVVWSYAITNYKGYEHSPWFVDGHVFAAEPVEAWKVGKINGASLLIGGNSADGQLEKPLSLHGVLTNTSDPDPIFAQVFASKADAVKKQYFPAEGRFNRSDAGIITAYRDGAVLCPSVMMAKFAHQANIDVFMYGWMGRGSIHLDGHEFDSLYGPDHAMPHAYELGAFSGPSVNPLLYSNATTKTVLSYWSSFVQTGKPTDPSQGTIWPKFGSPLSSKLAMSPYLLLGQDPPTVDGNPESDLKMPTVDDCSFWAKYNMNDGALLV